jgi:hypothetical protein
VVDALGAAAVAETAGPLAEVVDDPAVDADAGWVTVDDADLAVAAVVGATLVGAGPDVDVLGTAVVPTEAATEVAGPVLVVTGSAAASACSREAIICALCRLAPWKVRSPAASPRRVVTAMTAPNTLTSPF